MIDYHCSFGNPKTQDRPISDFDERLSLGQFIKYFVDVKHAVAFYQNYQSKICMYWSEYFVNW